MALVESLALTLGTQLPSFKLPDPSGALKGSQEEMGEKGLLIVFTCNHCPYAIAIWERLIALSKWAKPLGVSTIAVNPNIHPNYPDDSPEKMQEKIVAWRIPFPYLVDDSQEIAKAYHAQCTPDLYLLDSKHRLVYHGRLDNNWKEPEKVTQQELRDAIAAFSAGQNITATQYPSMGCSIKWKN